MWAAIIVVIGSLLGVIVGVGLTLLKDQAQLRREKDWQRRQLIREKLEEICQVIAFGWGFLGLKGQTRPLG